MRGGKTQFLSSYEDLFPHPTSSPVADGNILPFSGLLGRTTPSARMLDSRLENTNNSASNPPRLNGLFLTTHVPLCVGMSRRDYYIYIFTSGAAAMLVNMRTAATQGKLARHGQRPLRPRGAIGPSS